MMKPSDIKGMIPNEFIESLALRNISSFTPPQELAVKSGLLDGNSVVVAAPTASGKTLIAEMAIVKCVIGERRKAVYISPMRALVTEKYEEFKVQYPYLKAAMSIGELDSFDVWLANYDVIFVSTEKFDSLIRHGINWLALVGCIVFDEVHMIGEAGRGPTLEILVTKLKKMCPRAQLVALSATIGNAVELADWLGAKLVSSKYRPIELKEGIEYLSTVHFEAGEEKLMGSSKVAEVRIAEDVLERKKQLLVFYSTKRNAEAGAERLRTCVSERMSPEEKAKAHAVSELVAHALQQPTAQCKKLAACVEQGVAFHHSGLVNEQRRLIENAFKDNIVKAICSTTTLGLGVNLPAHTVVVRDTTRYDSIEGSGRIGVNEVKQLFGRAGRPKYDKEGRALLIAKTRQDISDLMERYINADLEPIESRLGIINILRTHVLAFIATRFLTAQESISSFFSETFYAYRYGSMHEINMLLKEVLDELEGWQFVEKHGSVYSATRLGERVSELYIDPMSARWLVDTLQKKRGELENLFMICNTIEMRPHARAGADALDKFAYSSATSEVYALDNNAEALSSYEPERAFATALMLDDWAQEVPEPDIVKKYSITPGALFSKVYNADWLLYAAMEFAKLMHSSASDLLRLRARLKYGIKDELLELVRLEQVGRVRARAMFNSGLRTVADLRKPGSREKMVNLFGKEIANRILSQLGNTDYSEADSA